MFLRSGGRNQFSANSYKHAIYRGLRRNESAFGYEIVYGILVLIIVAFAFITPQLVSEETAYNTAEGLGFTEVEVVDRDWLFIQFNGCDSKDLVRFTVTGLNPSGNQQTFYVCAGLFKAGTPRFP